MSAEIIEKVYLEKFTFPTNSTEQLTRTNFFRVPFKRTGVISVGCHAESETSETILTRNKELNNNFWTKQPLQTVF